MNPWRQTCESELRSFSDQDAIRFWGVHHETPAGPRPVFNYRFEHSLAAVKLARWLCPQVGADLDVVECAAWLHDARKRLKDPLSKDTHAQDASRAVADILADTDFPKEKIPAVCHAIEHHVGLRLSKRLDPLETACLWDCDKLSKLGAASLLHHGCISGAFQPITTAEILERGHSWLLLCEGIVDSMNTEPAKMEAARRLGFLTRHHEQLTREWAEPMLPCPM
jgi:uncharacterized protein